MAVLLLGLGLVLMGSNAEARHPGRASFTDFLKADGEFNTLVFALEATGLDEVLNEDGPFTLFAPTDDAFGALPPETLNFLIENPDALSEVLLYHVVEGRKSALRLLNRNTVTTVQGEPVLFLRQGRQLQVNSSEIIEGNIRVRKGIVHVIDEVLSIPEIESEELSLVDLLKTNDDFSTLVTALELTGLDQTLADAEKITLFAPNNAAFEALGEDTLNALIADPQALSDILLYHVSDNRLRLRRLFVKRHIPTLLEGQTLNVSFQKFRPFINDSQVIGFDIKTPNRTIVQVIDAVLTPQSE
jgi:uncharacterized surface protein with fasciclin (FAS1) repeats